MKHFISTLVISAALFSLSPNANACETDETACGITPPNRFAPVTEPMEGKTLEETNILRTIAAIKLIEAASSTFQDMYNNLPGDMPNAYKRLPECKSDNCGEGNGDTIITPQKMQKIAPFKDERHLFWAHLNKSKLLSGYDENSPELEWGKALPSSPLGGGFQIFDLTNMNQDPPHSFEGTKARKGRYILLTNDPSGTLEAENAHFLTSHQAKEIDRKLDDGAPLTGSVIAAGNNACLEKSNTIGTTYTDGNEPCLSLYIRIH
jgi:hypothetical protein